MQADSGSFQIFFVEAPLKQLNISFNTRHGRFQFVAGDTDELVFFSFGFFAELNFFQKFGLHFVQGAALFVDAVKGFHFQQQNIHVNRFADIIQTSGGVSAGDEVHIGAGSGKKDYGRFFGLAVTGNGFCYFKAVHLRHLYIQYDKDIGFFKDFFQCFFP